MSSSLSTLLSPHLRKAQYAIIGTVLALCWWWAFPWKEEARKTFTKHRRPLPLACSSARVFFGIFSVAAHRHIRDTYRKALGCEPHGEFTLRFILGRSSEALDEEEMSLGDIEFLDCAENLNRGKTFEYFTHVYHAYPCHAFYVKADEDTAFLPGRMRAFLLEVRRNHTDAVYVGRPLKGDPHWGPHPLVAWGNNNFAADMDWYFEVRRYMAGMLYALDREAVRRLVALEPTDISGDEDQRTGYWMQRLGAEWVDAGARFHDHPDYAPLLPIPLEIWPAPITNQSLAVHRCKAAGRLEAAIRRLCVFSRKKSAN
jgi:hypothetical protein